MPVNLFLRAKLGFYKNTFTLTGYFIFSFINEVAKKPEQLATTIRRKLNFHNLLIIFNYINHYLHRIKQTGSKKNTNIIGVLEIDLKKIGTIKSVHN